MASPFAIVGVILGVIVVLSTIPYLLVAIEYRGRDNGLAFILLVMGVGIWNGMLLVQLSSREPLVQSFFLALSVVGAVLAGLGFLMFATTANSTPTTFSRTAVYMSVGVLAGLDILFAVTAPVHSLYWEVIPESTESLGFVAIEPGIGYWLHTLLLIGLFATGVWLFWQASRKQTDRYPAGYVIAGTATILAIGISNVVVPGGFILSSVIAASITTVGWVQAGRGQPLSMLRSALQ